MRAQAPSPPPRSVPAPVRRHEARLLELYHAMCEALALEEAQCREDRIDAYNFTPGSIFAKSAASRAVRLASEARRVEIQDEYERDVARSEVTMHNEMIALKGYSKRPKVLDEEDSEIMYERGLIWYSD